MNRFLKCALLLLTLSSCCAKKVSIKPIRERTLSQVVQAIQDQYVKAQGDLKKNGIAIDITKADLTLKVSSVNTENADVTVLIVKPSTKFIQTKTTSITYELLPEEDKAGGGDQGSYAVNDKLRKLIVDAATKFDQLEPHLGALVKDNFSLDILFSIENDNSVGLTFTIWGVGADAGYENDKSVEQELVLTFKPTPPVKSK